MKKELLLTLLTLILFLPFVSAINETEQVALAYNWLSSSVEGKWAELGTEDAFFSLLALSYDDAIAGKGREEILKVSKKEECWPSDSCKVKDTSLALLALDRIGAETEKIEKWLLSQNTTPKELVWYMQIHTEEDAECSVSYDNKQYEFSIVDGKPNKGAGKCLGIAENGYWFKIDKNCLEKVFVVSCNKDFLVALLYKKAQTYYVSSQTSKETAKGIIEIAINARCLQDENAKTCSYEGTALAAYALAKKGYGTGIFLPYLVGYADANAKFFPEAFLYLLTGNTDYANKLLEQQKTGYWIAENSAYGKYYDTSLALLALQDYKTEESEAAIKKAKTWLLAEQTTKGDAAGSWKNSKRDTAFILFATWPKEPTKIEKRIWCEDAGYSCVPQYECADNSRVDYYCTGNYVCCEEKLKSCSDIGGIPCGEQQVCEGQLETASDTRYCCVGGNCRDKTECEKRNNVCRDECGEDEEEVEYKCEANKKCCEEKKEERKVREEWECEEKGNVCRDECIENEKEVEYECETGKVCCAEKPKRGLWWIWLLLLIIIVAFFFFKKRKKKPPTPSIPPIPPRRLMPFPPPIKPAFPLRKPLPPPPPRAAQTKTEKELEETMRKLKEISEK